MIATGLNHRGRGIQLIKEQDAFAILWQEIWGCPFGAPIGAKKWQAAQLDWIEEENTNIAQILLQASGELRYYCALANSWSAPKPNTD